jgi:hypothetical protein
MHCKLLYECSAPGRTKHRSNKEKMDGPTPMKTEQALNGLYPAVAAADDE